MPLPPSDVNRPLPPFDRPRAPVHSPKSTAAFKAFFIGLAVAVVAGCSGSGGSFPQGGHGHGALPQGSHGRGSGNISRALPATSPTPAPAALAQCGSHSADTECHVEKNPSIPVSSSPTSGLTAPQLRSIYGLPPASSGAIANGPLIAIVAAFEAPTAEADLRKYRREFGLPPCSSSSGCFTKVMMGGSEDGPGGQSDEDHRKPTSGTWADEIALDLAMASAACPTCKLLLVEAGGEDLDSLAAAVNTAASYHPAAISNSWGVLEGGGNAPNIDPMARAAFNHPGIAITASSGDLGQVEFPASSPYVTAVGGTSLAPNPASARGWDETAWSASGSGCSIIYTVPAWQTGSACTSGRAVADVSMLADYGPGVAVYSSVEGGWVVLGGTSVGAPFVAGLYGAANDYGAATTGAPKLYAGGAALNAVTGAAQGSPNGLAGF